MNVKKRKRQHLFFIVIIIVIVLLIVIGCAKKFTRETSITKMSEGEKAISVAKESNASIDAPADLTVALDKMTAAKKALQKEDYETATRMAEQAVRTGKRPTAISGILLAPSGPSSLKVTNQSSDAVSRATVSIILVGTKS